jgi:hypothetical protein
LLGGTSGHGLLGVGGWTQRGRRAVMYPRAREGRPAASISLDCSGAKVAFCGLQFTSLRLCRRSLTSTQFSARELGKGAENGRFSKEFGRECP